MSTMRDFGLKLSLMGSVLLGLGGCFISTEGEEDYEDTFYGGGSGGSSSSSTCSVGAPGCPCTITGVCDDGLVCIESIATCVVPDPCPIGAPGCDCTQAGTCDEGLVCKESYCVSEQPCLPEQTGTESCQCTEGGGCDPGLECLSGVCVDPEPVDGSGSTTGADPTDGDATGDAGGSTGAAEPPDATGGAATDGP